MIIGGGPAGLAAALYTARANLKPLLFAGSPPGGQLMLTSEVENYPGFESILGPDLIQMYRAHVQKFGVSIIDQNITKVLFNQSPFTLSSAEKSYQAKTVIIATGAQALWLGLRNEQRLRGKGVSACATCDGFFFRDKIVAVVGGGDTAMEEALTLTRFAKFVYIIHRRGEFRASKIMQDRVKKQPKIHIIYNAEVTDVLGAQNVEQIALRIQPSDKILLQKSKKEIEEATPQILKMKVIDIEKDYVVGQIPVDGLFIAIGHRPDTDIFASQLQLDSKGYIITSERFSLELAKLKIQNSKFKTTIENSKLEEIKNKFDLNFHSATSVPGVFAAGDCVDYVYRQAGTAVGTGIAAALEVEKWLELSSK
ncbi:hypothetical protein A2859_04290 [Candidatus Roizmanbacteria bacterium RIFCSPHIGHO2_01_FULL_37_16b]|nr:MAG: hypothetical protein A2859_04290 [Candidatus Roizmanbacteria bacterium RIFCSPHIGHO2_01_FULL_37_16b]